MLMNRDAHVTSVLPYFFSMTSIVNSLSLADVYVAVKDQVIPALRPMSCYVLGRS